MVVWCCVVESFNTFFFKIATRNANSMSWLQISSRYGKIIRLLLSMQRKYCRIISSVIHVCLISKCRVTDAQSSGWAVY